MVSLDIASCSSLHDLATKWSRSENPAKEIIEYLNANPTHASTVYQAYASELIRIGQSGNALTYYQKAIDLKPQDRKVLQRFAHALELNGMIDEAIDLRKKILDLSDADLSDYYALAGLQLKYAKMSAAIDLYEKLSLSHRNLPEIKIRIGNVYKSIGDFEKAESYYLEARKLNPEHAWALTSHLGIRKAKSLSDERVQKIEQLLSSRTLHPEKRTTLEYGLGKVYDQLGHYQEAKKCFVSANSNRRKKVPAYDHAGFEQSVDEIIRVFGNDLINSSRESSIEESPIFIVGMPRSGTTLIEQILSAHSGVLGGGELTDMNFMVSEIRRQGNFYNLSLADQINSFDSDSFTQLGKKYLKAVHIRLKSKRRFTDKLTHNFLHIGFIRLMFPKAKIIHCMRHPADTCLSIFKNNFATYHNYAYDLHEIASHYRAYQKIMNHWRETLEGYIYEVSYESLINSPEEEIRKLLQFCGLNTETACYDFHNNQRMVNTLSMSQVRQPIYNRSIGNWKHYESLMRPIESLWGDGYQQRMNELT